MKSGSYEVVLRPDEGKTLLGRDRPALDTTIDKDSDGDGDSDGYRLVDRKKEYHEAGKKEEY